MNTTIQQLKDRWKGHKERRFLESNGCKTWYEYERKFDPDFSAGARYVVNAYHGYPHIYQVTDYAIKWKMVRPAAISFSKIHDVIAWCNQNCQGKWRNDWHRVILDTTCMRYEIDGIGGSDIMFFAFKEESDFIWFKLVWE